MVPHWSLSDSKSPQVSGTLLCILAVLSNAVICIVSTRPSTYKSSGPFNNPLIIVPKAPITIGIIVTCMFQIFFNSLARSRYLSFFSHSFSLILWSARAFPSRSPGRPSRVSSYTPSVLICCICLLCDWWFHLSHRIAYICYFVESCLFSLWFDWFLWLCPVLLLGEIPFLS